MDELRKEVKNIKWMTWLNTLLLCVVIIKVPMRILSIPDKVIVGLAIVGAMLCLAMGMNLLGKKVHQKPTEQEHEA